MDNIIYLYRGNGLYLGFIKSGYIYSRDGIYLGWIENRLAWDSSGRFRGVLVEMNEINYIWINQFATPPVSRSPRPFPLPETPPTPPAFTVRPVTLPVGYSDGF